MINESYEILGNFFLTKVFFIFAPDSGVVGFVSVQSPLCNNETGTAMNQFLQIIFIKINLLWQIDS